MGGREREGEEQLGGHSRGGVEWQKEGHRLPLPTAFTLRQEDFASAHSLTHTSCHHHPPFPFTLPAGKTWVDTYGDYTLLNSTTGAKAYMYFKPCGWFGSGRYEVCVGIGGREVAKGEVCCEAGRGQGGRERAVGWAGSELGTGERGRY